MSKIFVWRSPLNWNYSIHVDFDHWIRFLFWLIRQKVKQERIENRKRKKKDPGKEVEMVMKENSQVLKINWFVCQMIAHALFHKWLLTSFGCQRNIRILCDRVQSLQFIHLEVHWNIFSIVYLLFTGNENYSISNDHPDKLLFFETFFYDFCFEASKMSNLFGWFIYPIFILCLEKWISQSRSDDLKVLLLMRTQKHTQIFFFSHENWIGWIQIW